MKSLISQNPICFPIAQLSPSFFNFRYPSPSRETITLLHDPHKRSICLRGPLKLFPVKATYATANSTSYGGWDDSRIVGDSINLGESTHLRDFLVSVGIDDKKHVFMFLAGVVCSFAISRVRVSTIIVFPASVLLFAVGFLIGFVRGGSSSEFRVDASKRKGKEESFRAYDDKLMSLLGFFDRVHVKVDNLKKRVETAIDANEIELEDLRNYVNVLESINLLALGSRKDLEATLEGLRDSSSVVLENQPKSKKNKEDLDAVGFALLQHVGEWFREKSVSRKTNKAKEKDSIKQRTFDYIGNGREQGNSSQAAKEGIHNYVCMAENRKQVLSQGPTANSMYWDIDARNAMSSENVTSNSMEMGETVKSYRDIEEYRHEYKRFRSVNDESETRKSSGNLLNSLNFRHRDAEASFVQEQMFMKSSRSFSSFNRKASDDERYRSKFREERPDTDLNYNNQFMPGSEFDSHSSAISDDLLFDRYLTEANDLLRQAKECIRSRDIDERAEVMLYKSAKLLTDVVAMKPMSLLAIGQLGNTYLLLGEIKLKISRELRYLLSRRDPLPLENENHVSMLKGLASDLRSKEKIASLLIDVCEECEELLVEAGRRYRLALSIDGNDVRALYNWGLALSFRAQLIADIGPETAFDADKVFMAAIDKFEAMMSKGNIYAPDALLRWGMVSQQRSRLRPTNSKQKVKLLQQARRLYEDALQMDSENRQIKEALSSCLTELNLRM